MKECKKCESLFEKALYDELGDQEEEFFNDIKPYKYE